MRKQGDEAQADSLSRKALIERAKLIQGSRQGREEDDYAAATQKDVV
jgi:hypothetical protein